jgi:GNAT superfamily N-acetyltransferase
MSIRELSENNLEPLMELYRDLHDSDLPPPPQEVVSSVWNSIKGNTSIRYFGFFEGEILVSACNIAVVPNLTRGCKPYGLIENVVTHMLYRRRGQGQEVLNAALSFAWSKHCYKVMLMTGRQDEATFRFYESTGFSRHEKEAFIAKPTNP